MGKRFTRQAFVLKAYLKAKWQVFWLTSFLAPSQSLELQTSGIIVLKNATKVYSFRKSSGFTPDSLLITIRMQAHG
jgi:hypothetical protein